MSEPVFIEPTIQRESGDCTIACLKMLAGKSYTEVINASPAGSHKNGMANYQTIATAAKLGLTLVQRRKFNQDEDIGILTLIPDPRKNGKVSRDEHVVVLLKGMVYDAYNARLWLNIDAFLAHERYRVGTLLRREDADTGIRELGAENSTRPDPWE